MSKESVNEALPWDLSNVKLLENGSWFMVQVDGQKLFVKIPEDQVKTFLAGGMVEAHHPMTANVEKPSYIPAILGTLEPWYIAGPKLIAPMHPVQAQAMDDALRMAVEEAKKGPKAQIIKPSGKLHLA